MVVPVTVLPMDIAQSAEAVQYTERIAADG